MISAVLGRFAGRPGGRRQAAVLITVALILASSLASVSASGSPAGSLVWRRSGYVVKVDPNLLTATMTAPNGTDFTSFPLLAAAGPNQLPTAWHPQISRSQSSLQATVKRPDGQIAERVSVSFYASFFTVSFALRPSDATSTPFFFSNGEVGFNLTGERSGFTPDPQQHSTFELLPQLSSVGWRPFSPPPLQLQLQYPAGWLGVGLLQVPDATRMWLDPSGAVGIDYPLQQLESFPDSGAGGLWQGLVRFPTFVITAAADPYAGLRAYGNALAFLGHAPQGLAPSPSWWLQPMADTWGEQLGDHATRGSSGFTAAWVSQFVGNWRERYGVAQFTVVIDARWQQALGSAEPDPARFGGTSGMRQLIDQLHAQGLKVILWWPLWGRGAPLGRTPGPPAPVPPSLQFDPTQPSAQAQVTSEVALMLGSGPGQLNADGLKLDWGYNLPTKVSNPQLGTGMAALYRYVSLIHSAAHSIKPDAMIDFSAAAPQFAAITDTVRLYDARTVAGWNLRAAITASANPYTLIDGDGWDAGPQGLLPHTLASAVFGIPAVYFATVWSDGEPLPPDLSADVGSALRVAQVRDRGIPHPLANGDWRLTTPRGNVLAQTMGGDTALVVWPSGSCPTVGRLFSSRSAAVTLSLPAGFKVTSFTSPSGDPIPFKLSAGSLTAKVTEGITYNIQGNQAGCG